MAPLNGSSSGQCSVLSQRLNAASWSGVMEALTTKSTVAMAGPPPPHPTHHPLTFILPPPRGRGQGEGGRRRGEGHHLRRIPRSRFHVSTSSCWPVSPADASEARYTKRSTTVSGLAPR